MTDELKNAMHFRHTPHQKQLMEFVDDNNTVLGTATGYPTPPGSHQPDNWAIWVPPLGVVNVQCSNERTIQLMLKALVVGLADHEKRREAHRVLYG